MSLYFKSSKATCIQFFLSFCSIHINLCKIQVRLLDFIIHCETFTDIKFICIQESGLSKYFNKHVYVYKCKPQSYQSAKILISSIIFILIIQQQNHMWRLGNLSLSQWKQSNCKNMSKAETVSKINVPKVQTSIYLGYINTAKLTLIWSKFQHI